jgi:hypothetical protein
MNGPNDEGAPRAPGDRGVADVLPPHADAEYSRTVAAILVEATRAALTFHSFLYSAFAEYEDLRADYTSLETAVYRIAVNAGWRSEDPTKEEMIDRYWELLHDRAMRADFPLDCPRTARVVKFRRYAP